MSDDDWTPRPPIHPRDGDWPEDVEQARAMICDRCGWAMKFPGEECRNCAYDRLRAELAAAREDSESAHKAMVTWRARAEAAEAELATVASFVNPMWQAKHASISADWIIEQLMLNEAEHVKEHASVEARLNEALLEIDQLKIGLVEMTDTPAPVISDAVVEAFRFDETPRDPNVSVRQEILQGIGRMLDHPSVYMGGASKMSLRRAEDILSYVETFITAAVLAEREECALAIDAYRKRYGGDWPALETLAAAIREPHKEGGE